MAGTQRLCIVLCIILLVPSIILSYPAEDGLALYEPDEWPLADQIVDKRRKMGWSMCSRFFKWRCGKERLVVRGR